MKNSITVLQGYVRAPEGVKYRGGRCLFTMQMEEDSAFCQVEVSSLKGLQLTHGMLVRAIGYLRSFVGRGNKVVMYVEIVAVATLGGPEDLWDSKAVSQLLQEIRGELF